MVSLRGEGREEGRERVERVSRPSRSVLLSFYCCFSTQNELGRKEAMLLYPYLLSSRKGSAFFEKGARLEGSKLELDASPSLRSSLRLPFLHLLLLHFYPSSCLLVSRTDLFLTLSSLQHHVDIDKIIQMATSHSPRPNSAQPLSHPLRSGTPNSQHQQQPSQSLMIQDTRMCLFVGNVRPWVSLLGR